MEIANMAILVILGFSTSALFGIHMELKREGHPKPMILIIMGLVFITAMIFAICY